MENEMKIIIRSLLVFFFVLVFGCIPVPERRVVVAPGPSVGPTPLFPADLLEEKIGFLSKTLEKEDLTEKDRKIALSLIDTYKSVKSISNGAFQEAEYEKVVRALLNNLNILDDFYFSKLEERAKVYSSSISLFAAKRKEIQEAYALGDHKGVINHCLELKAVLGPDALTAEISLMFALSLAKAGMLAEAKSIIEGIVPELDMSPDLNYLRAGIAEIHLQLGEREKAFQVYEKLTDTFHKQEVALQALNKRISRAPVEKREIDAPPSFRTGLEAHAKAQSDDELTTQPEFNTDQILYEVEQLIREHKFGEAWDLLVLKRGTVSSETELKIIDQALKRLERAQEEYLEETISMISEKKEAVQMARKFFDEEKYEQAISSLDTLAEREESHEIKELREQAVERLINRERNRAAKIFLTARRTQDPEKKEEYLRSSYNILQNLIEKYPSSSLINKVKSHLEKVEEELGKL
jgi:tetratricopeptide (TPR) repeat protein